jgi:hypothetical protein
VRRDLRFRKFADRFAKVDLLRRVLEFHGLALAPGRLGWGGGQHGDCN